MSLAKNKKGIEVSTLVEIILIIIAAGLIIGVFNYAASKADEQTSEKLCRGFNALRFATHIDKGPFTYDIVPGACKTLDKGDLPTSDYKDFEGGPKEAAKKEIREMMAKCWWMWLEGKQPNLFQTSTVRLQNKCFICYDFSLNKDVGTIQIPELIASLDYPYIAIDKSDRCAGGGQGGYCRKECKADPKYTRKSESSQCAEKFPDKPECCISEDRRDECLNKEGVCEAREGYKLFDKWQCKSGKCYVKKENFASYLDYIQGTGGISGGAGFLVYEDKLEEQGLTTKKKYGITIISPGNTPGWDTAAWGAGTLVSTAATLFGTYFAPGWTKKEVASLGATLTYLSFKMTQKSGAFAGYNYIYISEYGEIRDKCAVELGVDERL
ncbi:hypothetical protein HYX02_07910 [Candidatus Woesearchaeota archaeon]|nr:hypothetical protein [Candidatus Woesearchaeota archaeon]